MLELVVLPGVLVAFGETKEEMPGMYEDIVETVREPLIVLDPNLRVLSANRSFYNSFRVIPEETIGNLIYDLGNRQWDIPGLRILLEDILPKNNKFDDYEVEHVFSGVGHKIMLLNARRIIHKEKGPQMILLAIEDITERKRIENELKDYEERFRRLFETSKDGLLLIDKQTGNIVNVNPAIVKMLDYCCEDCIGMKLQDIGLLKDINDFTETIRELIQAGFINYENVFAETRQGQLINVDIYLVDRARFVQCNVRNITERKNLEAQLRQAQKMEVVGLLAGGVSHDFNNILTAIVGYGHLLKMKIKDDDPTTYNIDQILAAVERGAKLTQSLLAFSRKQVMNPRPVGFNTIVESVYKLLKRIIGEDIELKTLLTDEDVTVMADSGQIEQVLMNFATNAKDAMPDGGRLTIETERAELNEEYVKDHGFVVPGAYVIVSVTDTGTGMDEETKAKIFEPFFTTKVVGKGTGLGLAMIDGIIKQHKGYINVYSEPGKGSTFKIYLPAITARIEEIKREELAPVSGGNETVLVAEDDEAVRLYTKTVLQEFGYTVIEAKDGEDAVRVFSANSAGIKLIVTDMIMPKMPGNEVYEKAMLIRPDIKCLFMSGYSDDIIQKRGVLKEGVNFISKPFSPYDLLRNVRGALDNG